MLKEEIEKLLLDWISDVYVNFSRFGKQQEQVENLFFEYLSEWKQLKCDPEGFNSEQQYRADELDKKYVDIIYDLVKEV